MQSSTPAAREQAAPVESVANSLMAIGRLMRQRLHGDQMDPGTHHLLKGLMIHGGMRVTDLATLANLDTSTVSRHVQQLYKAGLIERSQHPDDGRAQQVDLTDEGRQLLDASLARRHALLHQSFADWDLDEIESLDRLLVRFVDDIEHTAAELEHHA